MRCPVCGQKLSATPDKAGRMARCPGCGDRVRIIAPPVVAAPAPRPGAPAPRAAPAPESPAPELAFAPLPPRASHPSSVLEPVIFEPEPPPAPEPEITPPAPVADLAVPPMPAAPVPGTGMLWKVLFVTVCPLALALGAFVGYIMRPATPEELVAQAWERAEQIEAEARQKAQEILDGARQQGGEGGGATPWGIGRPAGGARAYLSKVRVENAHVGKSQFNRTVVMGDVRNSGERTVTLLQLTISCLDQAGASIFEKKHYPVQSAEGAMGSVPSLDPGGVVSFSVGLDDAPPEWSDQVEVKVTHIELAD